MQTRATAQKVAVNVINKGYKMAALCINGELGMTSYKTSKILSHEENNSNQV